MVQCCLRPSVCLSLTLCIVAKRSVLAQKLYLTAYRKSYNNNNNNNKRQFVRRRNMSVDITRAPYRPYMRNLLVPKLTLTFVWRSFKFMLTFESHLSLNISKIVRDAYVCVCIFSISLSFKKVCSKLGMMP